MIQVDIMKEYPIIHEHTDLTKRDLQDFSVRISNDLTNASLERYPKEYIGSHNYIQFKITIDALGIDLIIFGNAIIENGRLDLKRLKDNIWVTKQLYKPNGCIITAKIFEVYKSYYDCFKEALLKLECYEMIPILDKKYKTIARIFDKEIKELGAD